jgi:hypothetical protein
MIHPIVIFAIKNAKTGCNALATITKCKTIKQGEK